MDLLTVMRRSPASGHFWAHLTLLDPFGSTICLEPQPIAGGAPKNRPRGALEHFSTFNSPGPTATAL
jgi:hypothetical protein